MNHIDAAFVVATSDETFDLTAKQGDAGGVIGVSDSSGVDIELDGADPSQVTAVRVWHDGALSAEQVEVLGTLLGDSAPGVIGAFGSSRPVRVGSRSRRLSSLSGDVSEDLTLYTSALDALERVETAAGVKPLLRLAAAVGNARGGLRLQTPQQMTKAELELAVFSAPTTAHVLLEQLINDAVRYGVLDPELAATISLSPRRATPASDPMLIDALQPVFSLASESMLRSTALTGATLRPAVVVDRASALRSGVSAHWVSDSNIEVLVEGDLDPSLPWWARARRDSDGTIIAASPLTRSPEQTGSTHAALLLVAELDHVVVDVVPSVNDPVLSHRIGSLAVAYEAGRRAGRLERLGRFNEAGAAWQECARLHGIAGDAQRQKMALSREFVNRPPAPATIVDHLL
jgi:hypothetical protein